jgi:DNA repair photolyase
MSADREVIKGRGVTSNPPNRFEPVAYTSDNVEEEPAGDLPGGPPRPATQFYRDLSQSIIAHNESPDIGFDSSINPYRGCEHGCVYCYARPMHEYLGLSAGLDFETKIMVKEDAPELLRAHLARAKWEPRFIALSGATDPYQPIERKLQLTRRVLQVLAEFRNPVGVITKNALVARDADVLAELARFNAVSVTVSVTSLDTELLRVMEPRTSHPRKRLEAVRVLADAGVPVGINIMPVIPALNDHEIPAILEAAAEAGATYAGCGMVRLPHGVKDLFEEWLHTHFPKRAERVLGHVREMRGGKLYDGRFGVRQSPEGEMAEQTKALFRLHRKRVGMAESAPDLSIAAFRRPGNEQLMLFSDLAEASPLKVCGTSEDRAG